MNANAEFLNYVYQNSQMGVDTLEQLLDITEDEKLQAYLKKQLEGYCKFHSEARDLLNRNGYDEKGLGTFEKIRTYLMVNLQTMADASTSLKRDLDAGKPSEVDGLIFQVVRLGRQYGVPTPRYNAVAAKLGYVEAAQ